MATPSSAFRPLIAVYLLLLGLLALSAAASFLPAGPWRSPIGLAIAVMKTALIFTVFMRLKAASGLVRVFALVGFTWLGIAVTLMMADYLSRGAPGG